jgi:hypothetical protein
MRPQQSCVIAGILHASMSDGPTVIANGRLHTGINKCVYERVVERELGLCRRDFPELSGSSTRRRRRLEASIIVVQVPHERGLRQFGCATKRR